MMLVYLTVKDYPVDCKWGNVLTI